MRDAVVRTAGLIGVPSDAGAGVPGAALAPQALRDAGLATALMRRGLCVCDRGDLRGPRNPQAPARDGYRHLAEVTAWNRGLHRAVSATLRAGELPLVMGGDHSLAMGSIGAVARHCAATRRKLRILWLDAHADFNTAEHSPSGNLHGMPLAMLCGFGPPAVRGLLGSPPPVAPHMVRQIGVRSIDPGEARLVREHGHVVFDMDTIRRRGMREVVAEALADVDDNTHLHVSFDIDFLDPALAPAVATTVQGGPGYDEARLCMALIAATGALASLDVVELNPRLDTGGRTAALVVDLVAALFGGRAASRRTLRASAPSHAGAVRVA